MKLALTYSIYGDKDLYMRGMVANCIQAKTVYPSTDVLVFYDDTVPEKTIEMCKSANPLVKCIDMNKEKWNPESARMLWRWLPLDPKEGYEYDIIVVRDADSRLTAREKWAMDKWLLESSATLMTIHDSISHCGVMGGMSACKCLFPNIGDAIRKWVAMSDSNKGLGIDQSFLNGVLKPMCGDSFLCIKGESIPVPYEGCVPGHIGCLDVPSWEEINGAK